MSDVAYVRDSIKTGGVSYYAQMNLVVLTNGFGVVVEHW